MERSVIIAGGSTVATIGGDSDVNFTGAYLTVIEVGNVIGPPVNSGKYSNFPDGPTDDSFCPS